MEPLPSKSRKYIRNAEFWGDNDLTRWVYRDSHSQIRVFRELEADFVRTYKEAPKGYKTKNPETLFENHHDIENLAIKHFLFELNRKNKSHEAFQKTLPSSNESNISSGVYSPSAETSSPASEVSPSYRLSTI